MKKISFRHNCCLSNKRLTTSIWKVKQDRPQKQIWWISTDPNNVRSEKSSSHCNSLKRPRVVIQLLNVQGTQDVASTTEGWQQPWATQMMPQQQKVDSIHGNPNAASATTADSINFQEPVSIQWWFHCLNPADKRSESHSINVCSQRRTGTSLQRKRTRNHLMEGQPILISAGSQRIDTGFAPDDTKITRDTAIVPH